MRYFSAKGKDYHCSDIFNWMAIDKDGSIYLYEKEPFVRVDCGYWTSGHCDSYDTYVYSDICYNYPNWLHSLVKL